MGHYAAEMASITPNEELIMRTRGLATLIEFPDYKFEVREGHGGVFLQAHYEEPDATAQVDGMVTQYTRKWLLSPAMTDSEIIFTFFKLCLTSMEHRTREFFKYKGQRIMSPHFDAEDLVKLCQDGRSDVGARR